MDTIYTRFKKAWNAFMSRDAPEAYEYNYDPGVSWFYNRPDRLRLSTSNDRTIINTIFNKIAVDAAAVDIKHIRVDDNDRFSEVVDSTLNSCFSIEANIDQTGRAFIQDAVTSLLDEGCIAIVPTYTSGDPWLTDSYNILCLRVGKIVQWYPDKVKVNLYNDKTGLKEDIILKKRMVAIVENPFYSIMNEPNSVLKRLVRKMSLLDIVDEQNSSGKLNMILQLPYTIKNQMREQQAENRTRSIESQLTTSKYGIAYIDGTEHITQLNRSLDNNLFSQVEYLTNLLFSQLGMTQDILNGTASEEVMLNYFNRTIEPILSAITEEMRRKFLTKTARSQKQTIRFFREPFRLTSINTLAEMADKFTRNEILSSNEIRQIIGYKPSDDPEADKLKNSNIRSPGEGSLPAPEPGEEDQTEGDDADNERTI